MRRSCAPLVSSLAVVGIHTPQIQYAQITGYSNAAAATPELGYKPQSTISTNLVTQPARVIATFMPAPRQAIEGVPQLMAYLNQALEYFLALQEDVEILDGSGGNDFSGILITSGIFTRNAEQSGIMQVSIWFCSKLIIRD